MNDHKREVFISYHTSSAADHVRKIAAALEGAGITCWYAPRDCGAQYASSIVQAIRQCKVFLMLLNEQSNISAHCLNEVNCAFERLKNHEEITLLPFRLDQCMLSDDVYYYLGRIHIMDGSLPPEIQRVQELVDRVLTILGKEPVKYASIAGEKGEEKTYSITGSIVYPDNRFVGRREELTAIRAKMTDNENKVFLVGMGGIGKSEIAKMYLKQHMTEYDVVVWMVFDTSLCHTIASDSILAIKGLSRQDYPEDDERAYFERKLRILKEIGDRRVLLVVDNFDMTESDPDLEAFCSGSYGVLFTTRYHQTCGNIPEVEVHPMEDEAELLELFRTEYTTALDSKAVEDVKRIVKLLDGHTLSIRLVASAMQNRRIQPEKMLQMLRQGSEEMKKQNAKAADMIFGRLRQVFHIATLSEPEQYLLKNLSILSMQGISVETLFDWCGMDDYDVIDELIRKSWVIHDPVNDEVHLHPLVADLMADTMKKDVACCEELVHNMCERCKINLTSYGEKLKLFAHVGAASNRIVEESPLWKLLIETKAKLLWDLSDNMAAAEIYGMLMERETDPEQKLTYHGKIAHCHNGIGDAAGCLVIAREAYATVEGIPDDQLTHGQGVEKVFLLHRLAESLRDLGQYEESIRYARLAMPLSAKFARVSVQQSVGWTGYHLAKSLFYMGQADEAEAVLRQSLQLFEEDNDAWSSLYAMDLLGQVLSHKGEFEKALEYSDRAREILLPSYGEEHVDVGHNLYWRANIYRKMGEAQMAEKYYRQAVEIYRNKNCHQKADKIEKIWKSE